MRVWITGAPPPVGVSTKATVCSETPTPPLCSAALMPVLVPSTTVPPPALSASVVGSVAIENGAAADAEARLVVPAKPAVSS